MTDFTEWLRQYRQAVEGAFGTRVRFLGIQGSRDRGEARPDSDIDVVLILDRLSIGDLEMYRRTIDSLPDRGLICGFVSGEEELAHWTRGELFQFYHDTKPLLGDLDFLRPMAGRDGAVEAVHSGACALYHACVHNFVHGRNRELLRELYKSAVFVLQAKYFAENGVYLSERARLLEKLEGEDLLILRIGEALRRGEDTSFDCCAKSLLNWSGALIRQMR